MKLKYFSSAAALPVLLSMLPAAAMAESRPDSHAPIGVMADHTHHSGEVMISYRLMHMDMGGTRIGTERINPDTIVTTQPNRFAGRPGQPPTLRIAPLHMRMNMHMFGLMYAPSDAVTLMAMGNYVSKEMSHRTYQGGMGANVLGGFTATPEGFGDTSISAIVPLVKSHQFELNAKAGISAPTGSTTQSAQVLTPMNMQPELRLPYAMQLGSGTWDMLPGVTVKGQSRDWGWGAQYAGKIRTGTGDQGYKFGNAHNVTAWVSRRLAPWISTSLRLSGTATGRIKGIDPQVVAPVQTADPENYGGDRIEAYLGANLLAAKGPFEGLRFGIELGVPVMQDLNGPQMERDWSLTVGLQKVL